MDQLLKRFNKHAKLISTFSIWLGSMVLSSVIYANPVLNFIEHGNVTVQQTSTTTTVNQASQQGIVDWQSFNIQQGEHTHFNQPTNGWTLNKINGGQGVSEIYGQLSSTGQIILVNPSGVFFGPSSFVNVGGIIASTAGISNADFLSGQFRFNQLVADPGMIVNQGTIIAAQNGLVALVGNGVTNSGNIQANLGSVVLGSGNAFTMSFAGNELISFSVDEGSVRGITNTGNIEANGGKVIVSAKAASNVLNQVVNLDGVIQASSVNARRGSIRLMSDAERGYMIMKAKIRAKANNLNEKGGRVEITGRYIVLHDGTTIDASGPGGGGDILIGGDYQGRGTLARAIEVIMMPGVEIRADATHNGNGGKVILWSDDYTGVSGIISARGGPQGGDGGFIETSGKKILDVGDMYVNTSASKGKSGTWLLDPGNIDIDASLAATVSSNLASGNVTLQSTTELGDQGDIFVNSPVTWTSTNTLKLISDDDLRFYAAVSGVNGRLEMDVDSDITSNASGTISVAEFRIIRGAYLQNTASLPAFAATQEFIIDTGATFVRSQGGSGTGGNPYQLEDVYGLQGIQTNLGLSYRLDANIDASVTANWDGGEGFAPIGTFTGTLDGNGFVINDLHISRFVNNVGLFSATSAASTIQDVGIVGGSISGSGNVGGLVGNSSGTIQNSFTNNTVYGDASSIGGLVGLQSAGAISQVYSSSNVSNAGSNSSLGGLIGHMSGGSSLARSYFDGNVTVGAGSFDTGGVVGQNIGTVTISDSYFAGTFYAPSGALGSTGAFIGTLRDNSTLQNAYASGYTNLDALVGNTCCNTTGSNANSSYYNTQTTGTNSHNLSPGTSAVGKTTAQLMDVNTYTGWNFSTVWGIVDGKSFPYLKAFYSSTPRAISGTLSNGAANVAVSLNVGGSAAQSTVRTGDNGFYYFLEGNNIITGVNKTIANNTPILAYIDDNAVDGNTLAFAPTSNGSLSDITIYPNEVRYELASGTGSITNANFNTAKGTNSDGDILFTVPSNLSISSSSVNLTFDVDTGATLTYDGVYTGSGNLVKDGPGILDLGGVSTYSGTTTISDGELQATIANALGTGNVFINNGKTLSLFADYTHTTFNDIFMSGTSSDTYLRFYNNAEIIDRNIDINIDGVNNVIWVDASTTSQIHDSITNNIETGSSGTDGWIKEGTGTFELDNSSGNNNTYNGPTHIKEGTLKYTQSRAPLPDTTDVTIDLNATLDINGFSDTIASLSGAGDVILGSATLTLNQSSNTTHSGDISGTGSLTKLGTGIFTLSGTNNTYSGNTNISAGTLEVGVNNATSTASNVVMLAGATFDVNDKTTTIEALAGDGSVTLGSGTLTTGDGDNTTFSGVISQTGNLTKQGAGIFTLSGLNTYSGNTNINAGTLQAGINNATSASSDVVMLAGATFDVNDKTTTIEALAGNGSVTLGSGTLLTGDGDNTTFSGVISETGNLTKQGAGIFTLSGLNIYSGNTNINAGTLRVGTNSATSAASDVVMLAGATFDVNDKTTTIEALSGNGSVTLGSGTLLTGDGDNTTFSGIISETGNLTKQGSGIFTLSGLNTYSGNTNINAGTLQAGINGATSAASDVVMLAGATFDVNDKTTTIEALAGNGLVTLGSGTLLTGDGDNTTFSGVISETGNLTKQGAGIFTLSGLNIYSGNTNIYAGTLQAGIHNATSASSDVVMLAGATFDVNDKTTTIEALTGNGSVTLGSGTLLTGDGDNTTFSGVISETGNLTKQGSGIFTLSGLNTYSGNTNINAGTLRVGTNSATSAASDVVMLTGTTFDVNDKTTTIEALAGNGSVTLGSGTLTTGDGDNTTFSGVISETGNLTKQGAGIFTLSGLNIYSGNTNINAGTLQAGINNATSATSDVVMLAGATFDVNDKTTTIEALAGNGSVTLGSGTLTTGDGDNTTFSGVISETGNIIKQGVGIFTLSGLNTYSGRTDINVGTIKVGINNATSPDSAMTIAAGATLDINGLATEVASLAGAGDAINPFIFRAGRNNTSTLFTGTIGSGTAFEKVGTGIMTVSDTIDPSNTNIFAGTILLTSNEVLNDLTHLYIDPGATFDLNNFNETVGTVRNGFSGNGGSVTLGSGTLTTGANGSSTFDGVISETGNLIKEGGGIFTIEGLNTYTGNTTINAGTIRVGANNATSADSELSISGGATLDVNDFTTTLESLSGSGFVTLGAGSAGTLTTGNNTDTTYSGVISEAGNLIKEGAGTFTLAGNSSYSGTTLVNTGRIIIDHNNGFGVSVVTAEPNTTIRLNDAIVLNNILNLNGTGNFGQGVLTANGSVTTNGAINLESDSLVAMLNAPDVFTLNSTIDGPGALELIGGDEYEFNGDVGSITPLASLLAKTKTQYAANITTVGNQTYLREMTNTGNYTLKLTDEADVKLHNILNPGGGLFTILGVLTDSNLILYSLSNTVTVLDGFRGLVNDTVYFEGFKNLINTGGVTQIGFIQPTVINKDSGKAITNGFIMQFVGYNPSSFDPSYGASHELHHSLNIDIKTHQSTSRMNAYIINVLTRPAGNTPAISIDYKLFDDEYLKIKNTPPTFRISQSQ